MPEEIPTVTEESVTSIEEVVEESAVEESESATDNEETEETTADEGSEPKQSKAVKELINVRKRAQTAEAEAAYYKALAQQGSGQGLPPQAPQPAYDPNKPVVDIPTTKAPKSEDFETWEEFEAAKEDHLLAKARQQFIADFNRNIQLNNQSQAEQNFAAKIESASITNPAIRTILTDATLPINKEMAEIIKSSDNAPDLLVYLNEHRKDAARIHGLSPIMAAKELGRIEAMLENTPKAPPPKKISQAPEPLKTVSGSGSNQVDESKLSIDEWVARRNKAQFNKK